MTTLATLLAVVGAVRVSAAFVRFVVWLDEPRS